MSESCGIKVTGVGHCTLSRNHNGAHAVQTIWPESIRTYTQSEVDDLVNAAHVGALLAAGDWFLNWCDRVGVKVEESAIRQGLALTTESGQRAIEAKIAEAQLEEAEWWARNEKLSENESRRLADCRAAVERLKGAGK